MPRASRWANRRADPGWAGVGGRALQSRAAPQCGLGASALHAAERRGARCAFTPKRPAVEDPVHTYYMACGFQRGYFGMQVNSPTERRIIFSVWDTGAGAKREEARRGGRGGPHRAAGEGAGRGGERLWRRRHRRAQPSHLPVEDRRDAALPASPRSPASTARAIYSGYWFHPGEEGVDADRHLSSAEGERGAERTFIRSARTSSARMAICGARRSSATSGCTCTAAIGAR